MNTTSRTLLALAVAGFATQAAAEVTFYENDNFAGRSFTSKASVANFERSGFNDRASSVVVLGERWEACEDVRFGGRCMVLRPGRYPSLAAMGMNNRLSSVRPLGASVVVEEGRYAQGSEPVYDNRRRGGERLFEANVTSSRAVAGTPQQRCWIEHEPIAQERPAGPSIPGAVVGAVLGGILGHQVGAGRGNDIATVGGAVAGGAIGSQVGGRFGAPGPVQTRDVQKCENVANPGRPDYWDVTYTFRNQEHRVQMTTPPGRTIVVNRDGEPRAEQRPG